MKNSKLAKFGIVSLSVLALSTVIPLAPTAFAEENQPTTEVVNPPAENQQPLKYRVYYFDSRTNEHLGQKEGYVSPGQTAVEYPATFPGYTPVDPGVGIRYDYAYEVTNKGHDVGYIRKDTDGVPYGGIYYRKDKTPETPAEQPQTPPEVPATKPETPAEKPAEKPAEQPTEEPAKPAQPETPATKPAEEPQKPADKPVEPAKPEVSATKPETPAEKPSDKPAEKPTTPDKPTEKPATKPTDTNKPVVNPADNGKPEVKPENKVEPKAEVKPTQQSGTATANAQTPAPKAETKAPAAAAPKADKPTDKKMETLPNTGEAQSPLALVGMALGVLGLQGLTYKGRHDRRK